LNLSIYIIVEFIISIKYPSFGLLSLEKEPHIKEAEKKCVVCPQVNFL
jgi:hypothetical protein